MGAHPARLDGQGSRATKIPHLSQSAGPNVATSDLFPDDEPETIRSEARGLWSANTRRYLQEGHILPIISNFLLPQVLDVHEADLAR